MTIVKGNKSRLIGKIPGISLSYKYKCYMAAKSYYIKNTEFTLLT